MSPTHALAHVFFPNLVKLKGAATIVGVIERKEKFFFDAVWSQAHLTHSPMLIAQERSSSDNTKTYRVGVVDLPAPNDLGDAHFVGIVVDKKDPNSGRFFLLEHDYVLAKKADRTLVTEREGTRHTKHFEGPVLTGDKETDAKAFIDAFMELLIPMKVAQKEERRW